MEGELVFLEPVDWEKGLREQDLDGKIGLFLGGYGESPEVFRQLHESTLRGLIFVETQLQVDWPTANGVGEKFMKLIRKPVQPRFNPLIGLKLRRKKYYSWKHFLDEAYWSVTLK